MTIYITTEIASKQIFMDRTQRLTLGNVSANIDVATVPGDITSGFLYFNLNTMPDFVEEGARLVSERITLLGLKNPHIITPESSTIAMMHVLHIKYNIPSTILSKRRRPGDKNVISIQYCAVTSKHSNMLFIEKSHNFSGKDLVIVDNVVTTGETLKAVDALLKSIGAPHAVEAIVLFTEGKDSDHWDYVETADKQHLRLHRFSHIPLFTLDAMKAEPQFKHYSSSSIPSDWGRTMDPTGELITGNMNFHVFRHRCMEVEAVAVVGDKTFIDPEIQLVNGKWNVVPVRIHDACITSEAFHSMKCDCRHQLEAGMRYIAQYGGIFIYLFQEGRGIGLGNKISAYNLQETKGLDTVEANRALGLPDDTRDYTAARDILNHFNIRSVSLMTNNPRKVKTLKDLGIEVSNRIPIHVVPVSSQMKRYVDTKISKMDHMK